MAEGFDKGYWEDRYRGHTEGGGREPNATLVAVAGDLAAGAALDAGCGEGADAIWLASHGWQVTAVDVAATALERARAQATKLGVEVAGRIEWLEEDLARWGPPQGRFDLVSAHYVHVPAAAQEGFLRHLAEAVAPGGTLLVVGHHPSDRETTISRGSAPELYLTTEEVGAVLGSERWEIELAETRPRQEAHCHGQSPGQSPGHGHTPEVTVTDTVLRARLRTLPA